MSSPRGSPRSYSAGSGSVRTAAGCATRFAPPLKEFCAFATAREVPGIHTLATTVDSSQQLVIATIDTGLSNARSEGHNRVVKHIGSRSGSATPTTNSAAYGGPAPAEPGPCHPR